MMKHNFGIYGLGVMGASLAKNIERNGVPTVIYNYTHDLTEQFMAALTVYEFFHALERPGRILVLSICSFMRHSVRMYKSG